jgi:LacI family transcriptional regulator
MVLNHIEGLVVIPAAVGKSRFDRPEFHSTHIVMLDRPVKGHRFNSVLTENQNGATIAVRHLIEHGHKRIQFLGLSDKLYTLTARYQGYRKAMLEAGLIPGQHLTSSTEEETRALIQKALSQRKGPTAFFMGNNLVMRHALHSFSRLNVKIPDEVAIVGFDDFEMADIFNPAITVIRQPSFELGRVAAELLFARLANTKASFAGQQIVLPVELVIRESCGCNPRKTPNIHSSKEE